MPTSCIVHGSADEAIVVIIPAITNWRNKGPLGVPISENAALLTCGALRITRNGY